MNAFNLNIRGKILLVNGVILLLMAVSLLYIFKEVGNNSGIIQNQQTTLDRLETAVGVENTFAKMRYWLTDLSVSWQNDSETEARTAKEELDKLFAKLEKTDQGMVQSLRPQVDAYIDSMMKAVDAYIDGNRTLGNSLVDDGRKYSAAIDGELSKLLAGAETLTKEAGESVLGANDWIRRLSLILIAAGIFLGAILSFWFSSSLTRPIVALTDGLENFAAGNLRAIQELRVKSRDELGRLADSFNALFHNVKAFLQNADDLLAGKLPKSENFGLKGEFERKLGAMLDQARAKKTSDEEAARVVAMVENIPMNMMYADSDFNIKYMNPASQGTLQKLEQYLPVKAGQIVGQSIDIFHKNPGNVRKIVSDPRNLPHHTHIQLGPEILDLLVTAIYDNKQNYLGPMVTWQVVTEKVATEQKARELAEREKAQAEELRRKVDSMLDVVSAAAKGDLTREVTVNGGDAIGQMGQGLGGFFSTLRRSVSTIAKNAQSLASSSEQLSSLSQQMAGNAVETSSQSNVVSAASEDVRKSVETVATGAEEM
ncbi:MAG: HAMP domain-containing protein, partial [Nitrospinae bacterium]|nr:HAMP domain-containing protein [Nitrospinota bacterium]